MAERSAIEWCDATFNPWIGCTKVSPGCDNCYAAQQDSFRKWTPAGWGAGQPRKRTKTWGEPVKWNASRFFQCVKCGWRGEVPQDKALAAAGKLGFYSHECGGDLVEVRRRVFCASLADVFDNEVPDQWRDDLFRLILDTPHLDWLLLTKRIGNVAKMLDADQWEHLGNVWLGATIVNREEMLRDAPKLAAIPARVHFWSVEPQLGDLAEVPHGWLPSWVIVGGESGPNARSMQLQWARDIVRQCRAAGVPVLVKQLGHVVLDDGMSSPGEHWPSGMARYPIPRRLEADPGFAMRLKHAKGGDWSEWPEDLRVRQFPEVRA